MPGYYRVKPHAHEVAFLAVIRDWDVLRARFGRWVCTVSGLLLGLSLGTDLLAAYWCVTAAVLALTGLFLKKIDLLDLALAGLGGVVGLMVSSPMYFLALPALWGDSLRVGSGAGASKAA